MEYLDYVEREAKENLRFHLNVLETLNKEAHTLLSIQLLFAGASFGYAIKLVQAGGFPPLAVATVALTLYIAVLAATNGITCLMHSEMQAPANEPKNLLLDDVELEALRLAELDNYQERIDLVQGRNTLTADVLNKLRLLAIASPAVFAVVSIVTSLVL